MQAAHVVLVGLRVDFRLGHLGYEIQRSAGPDALARLDRAPGDYARKRRPYGALLQLALEQPKRAFVLRKSGVGRGVGRAQPGRKIARCFQFSLGNDSAARQFLRPSQIVFRLGGSERGGRGFGRTGVAAGQSLFPLGIVVDQADTRHGLASRHAIALADDRFLDGARNLDPDGGFANRPQPATHHDEINNLAGLGGNNDHPWLPSKPKCQARRNKCNAGKHQSRTPGRARSLRALNIISERFLLQLGRRVVCGHSDLDQLAGSG